jgi:anti-sigma B factor antagonist
VLLDMTAVGFLTSTALGKLVILHKKLKGVQGELKICGLRASIESIFRITRLDTLFDIHADESSALMAFAKR